MYSTPKKFFTKPIIGVVSLDRNYGMGYQGDLLVRLKEDMIWFKELTTAQNSSRLPNAVIMGRKTWESIPNRFRPLVGRINYVLTSTPEQIEKSNDGKINNQVLAFSDWNTVLRHAETHAEVVFVIGGRDIFEQALALEQFRSLYVTEIEAEYKADTFFPSFPLVKERFPSKTKIKTGGGMVRFTIYRYDR